MLGVKIFVRVRTFRRMPFAPSRIFCHPVIRINKINSLLSARVNVFSPENLNNRIHLRLLSVFSTHGFLADLTTMYNMLSEPCYDDLLPRKSNLKSSCQHGGRKWTSSPATQVKSKNIIPTFGKIHNSVRNSNYIENYPLMPLYRGDGSRSMAAPGLECDAILIGDLRI